MIRKTKRSAEAKKGKNKFKKAEPMSEERLNQLRKNWIFTTQNPARLILTENGNIYAEIITRSDKPEGIESIRLLGPVGKIEELKRLVDEQKDGDQSISEITRVMRKIVELKKVSSVRVDLEEFLRNPEKTLAAKQETKEVTEDLKSA